MKQTEKECKCACHENKLKKPYEHDSVCCDDMNGFIPGITVWKGKAYTLPEEGCIGTKLFTEFANIPIGERPKWFENLVKKISQTAKHESYEKGFQDGHAKERWLMEEVKKEVRKELVEMVEDLIVKEILICHEENTPTSRLTSLAMKIKKT